MSETERSDLSEQEREALRWREHPSVQDVLAGNEVRSEIAGSATLRYVLEEAEKDAQAALEAIGRAEPGDTDTIMYHQFDLMVARSLKFYIGRKLDQADAAFEQLELENATDT